MARRGHKKGRKGGSKRASRHLRTKAAHRGRKGHGMEMRISKRGAKRGRRGSRKG